MFFLNFIVSLLVLIASFKGDEAKFLTNSSNFVGCFSMSTSFAVFTTGLTQTQASAINTLISGSTKSATTGGYAVSVTAMLTDKCLGICLTYSFKYAGIGKR